MQFKKSELLLFFLMRLIPLFALSPTRFEKTFVGGRVRQLAYAATIGGMGFITSSFIHFLELAIFHFHFDI